MGRGAAACAQAALRRPSAHAASSSLRPGRAALAGVSRVPWPPCRVGGPRARGLCASPPAGFDGLGRLREAHRDALRRSVTVLPGFASAEEEAAIVRAAEEHFADRGVEYARGPGTATGGCIDRYREYDTEFDVAGSGEAAAAIRRLRGVVKMLALTRGSPEAEGEGGFSLAALHAGDQTDAALRVVDASVPDALLYPSYRVIDLAADGGVITAHVDDQTMFGRFILVLNLLTDAVLRLRALPPLRPGAEWWPAEGEFADFAVPRRGAYLLAGLSRYAYTHEVLPGSGPRSLLSWAGRSWPQSRRLSVVVRDAGPGFSPMGDAAFAPEEVAGELVGPGTHWPCRDTSLDARLAERLGEWMRVHGPGLQS